MNLKCLFGTPLSSRYTDGWLLIFRVCIAAFMLTHGLPKLAKLMQGGEIKFADPIGIGQVPSLILVVFAEVVCSFLLIAGIATRLVAGFLLINMLVAAFIATSGMPFEKRESAFLYLIIYITILIFGAGNYSIDGLLIKKWSAKN